MQLQPITNGVPSPMGSAMRKALLLGQEDAAELWLVRHAEPDRSQADPDALSSDPPLSELGIYQAFRLAERVKNSEITAVYSSPYRRTMETANIIANSCGLPVTTLADVSEIQLYAHRPPDSIVSVLKQTMAKYRDEIEHAFMETGRWTAFPFCETGLEFRRRITGAIEELVRHHLSQRVVLVTHNPVINGYLAH
ncbi:MAG: histidine phosphatase family protein, partial [Dehalococcoidia bacterium]|nr:histidine phosphatase family protein [Dehalococcoidia bacterium]